MNKSISSNKYMWYALHILVGHEETTAKNLNELIEAYKLHDSIQRVCILKKYVIEESPEYAPGDINLPKTFRNTKRSQWVTLNSGKYKKISIKEEKPFPRMVFIKMINDPKMFEFIRKWIPKSHFLISAPGSPEPISEEEFHKKEILYPENQIIDLNDYIAKNILNIKSKQIFADKLDQTTTDENLNEEIAIFDEFETNQNTEKLDDLRWKYDGDDASDFLVTNIPDTSVEFVKPEEIVSTKSISDQSKLAENKPTPMIEPEPEPIPGIEIQPEPEVVVNKEIQEPELILDFDVNDTVLYSSIGENAKVISIDKQNKKATIEYMFFGRTQNEEVDLVELESIK